MLSIEDYERSCDIASELKTIVLERAPEYCCQPVHHETLDSICVCMSHIMSGKCDDPNLWSKISEYATMMVKITKEKQRHD